MHPNNTNQRIQKLVFTRVVFLQKEEIKEWIANISAALQQARGLAYAQAKGHAVDPTLMAAVSSMSAFLLRVYACAFVLHGDGHIVWSFDPLAPLDGCVQCVCACLFFFFLLLMYIFSSHRTSASRAGCIRRARHVHPPLYAHFHTITRSQPQAQAHAHVCAQAHTQIRRHVNRV